MTQSQYARQDAQHDAELRFKRHILEQSAGFASEPMADLYRMNLLGMMLGRYDELVEGGLSGPAAIRRTISEYADIPARMQDAGFAEVEADAAYDSAWPQMTEDEAAQYIEERGVCLRKRFTGVTMCVACLTPLMLLGAVAEMFFADLFYMLGLMGMFGMIGMGVYSIVMAPKPKDEKRVCSRQFSLSSRVRKKLMQLADAAEEKARRRMGKGIALIVMSMMPVLGFAFLEDLFQPDIWPLIGVAGMFAMIAAGVYQLCMSGGERKTMKNLLDV